MLCLGQSAVDGGDSYLVPVVGQTLDDAHVGVGLLNEERTHGWTVVGVDRVCGHTVTSESHTKMMMVMVVVMVVVVVVMVTMMMILIIIMKYLFSMNLYFYQSSARCTKKKKNKKRKKG